jgi:putative acetyltransferase
MLKRTSSADIDFQNLVNLLDKDLAIRNGEVNAFYVQFNKIDDIRNVVVYYEGDMAVGCGAFKEFDQGAVEVKRMFVKPEFRGRRIGAGILKELEQWASELKYKECVLETGKTNPEALHLYKKEGYEIIQNYGQYEDAENSVCMRKRIG